MGNIRDHIILQIALRKGYPILTTVKPIKYSKEKSIGPFKATLKVSK
jgi:hypothetical protein